MKNGVVRERTTPCVTASLVAKPFYDATRDAFLPLFFASPSSTLPVELHSTIGAYPTTANPAWTCRHIPPTEEYTMT